jgi:hypothetical protein
VSAQIEQHTQQTTRWAVCVKTQSGWGTLGAYTICLVLADKADAERTVAACCTIHPGGYVVQEVTEPHPVQKPAEGETAR